MVPKETAIEEDEPVMVAPSKYELSTSAVDLNKEFMKVMHCAPTVFHFVKLTASTLEKHGFVYLSEREDWEKKISESNKFYTTRNGSSLVAFVVGKSWKPRNGAAIIGAHIDALTAKLKPISKKEEIDGYELLGAAPYAGGFNSTWWDRDLGLGGRLVVRDGEGKITSKLVKLPQPVARIPTLAPHFGKKSQGPFDKETQMNPVVGLASGDVPEPTEDEKKAPLYGKHSLRLLRAVARAADVKVSDIIDADLELYDTQKPAVGGLDNEFLFCPRIDDKINSFAAITGLLDSLNTTEENSSLSVVALFDNEEIGSQLRQGAKGNFLDSVLQRLVALHGDADVATIHELQANSFMLSADVIHAVNPNFSSAYLDHHKPKLNKGVTISLDPNGNMTTDAVSLAFIEEIARRSDNTVQYFQIRNGEPSGGTIGPMTSARTGIRTVDLGIPQLSMHSIRATTGSKDVYLGARLFKAFFELWEEVDNEFKLGDL